MRTLVMLSLCGALLAGFALPARAAEPARDADNTARNQRDRDDRTLTPMDQGGTAADRTITQDIRKMITEDDGLSTNAKNVKVITIDGVVTLRGPVKSEAEKTTVAGMARKASGVKRVVDQLEVEHNR